MIIVLVAGNLGSDPEVRYSSAGKKYTTFSVASNEKLQGKDETTWVRVTVFGEHLDKIISFLKKGSAVMVSGTLRFGKYKDKEGIERNSNDVIADNIRFSPFGRPAEPGQPQAQRAPNSFAQPAPSTFQPQPAHNAYGAPPAYTPPHQAQQPLDIHDFNFGNTHAEAPNGGYEETPF